MHIQHIAIFIFAVLFWSACSTQPSPSHQNEAGITQQDASINQQDTTASHPDTATNQQDAPANQQDASGSPTDTDHSKDTVGNPETNKPVTSAKGLFKLLDGLDDPMHYCLDVPGFRASVQLKSPLMAHTCKPGAEDELFTTNYPKPGQIYIEAYKLCAQASISEKKVYLKDCSDAPEQRFSYTSNKKLQVSSSKEPLCIVVADGSGEPAGGRNHLRRDLLLQKCSDTKDKLSQWTIPGHSLGQ